jgi:plastocyanin
MALVAVALLAAGCSSGSPSSGGSPSTTAGSGKSSSGSGIRVIATETEFHIALSRTSFSPGTYTFVAVDKGKASHNLNVVGPGVNSNIGVLLSPGQSASVTVTLRKGRYDIFCSVPGHQAMGMDVHITVS